MTNEMLQECIGKSCIVSTGTYGTSIKGRIIEAADNWMKIDTGNAVSLVNMEFVQTIRFLSAGK